MFQGDYKVSLSVFSLCCKPIRTIGSPGITSVIYDGAVTGISQNRGDSLRRGFHALRQARGRMNSAWNQQDGDAFFISSVEVAVWICSVDDFLRMGKCGPSYRERRDADGGGRIVNGLRWARNAGIHQLVNVYEIPGGFTSPTEFSVSVPAIRAVWKHRRNVQAGVRKKKNNEEAYDKLLVDNPVQETLDSAFDFLWLRAVPVVFLGTELDKTLSGS